MVRYITGARIATEVVVVTATGDGSTTAFTITAGDFENEKVLVFLNGVAQLPATDYNITGSQLIFNTAPTSLETIMIYVLPI
jgi:hypothetical protein